MQTALKIMGFLAALSFVGGFVALSWNVMEPTEFTRWHLSTGSAGIAFIGIGVLVAYMALRRSEQQQSPPR